MQYRMALIVYEMNAYKYASLSSEVEERVLILRPLRVVAWP